MKKIVICLFIFTLFTTPAYSFWIWSPKTQKWKNPKYSALATPYLQYKEAVKSFDTEDYKRAYKEFKKLLVHYPDAKEAAEAQYYIGRCLEKMDKSYDAFLEYQKVIDSYPNSQRITEVVEREYNIGEYFLNREHKQWIGISMYDFVEHPSVNIFKTIVDKVPYSEYAPRAQYKLGMIFANLSRYEEARDAFGKVLDDYADSEWAAPAKYQLATVTAKAVSGTDYDSTYLREAAERLDEFIEDHPEAQISSEAQDQLKILRGREAKKIFDIAKFYENQNKYSAAVLYYKKVTSNYSDTEYYSLSLDKIEELKPLIEGNVTKKELIKEKKLEEKQTRIEEKKKLKEEKKKAALKKKEEAKARKEEVRAEKARLKKEAQQKKEELHKEKLEEKQEHIEEKQETVLKEKKEVKENIEDKTSKESTQETKGSSRERDEYRSRREIRIEDE